jgi:hypothetical protein
LRQASISKDGRAAPLAETLRAVDGIATDADFARDYANFHWDMVYGEAADFKTAAPQKGATMNCSAGDTSVSLRPAGLKEPSI